jgi:acetyl-CoA carboxylase carboxyl transferase subunit alpha
MNPNYLDFEQPIADLEAKIEALRLVGNDNDLNISDEITKLADKSISLTESIFSNLTAAQVSKVSRHPQRPHTIDYMASIFDEFDELHGDRHFGDDQAMVCGIARLNGKAVMVMGQEKGRSTKEKVARNFGMPRPEGYRKALRMMKMAERFNMPILTFIDTPGAYPGIDAEERGQSEAIAFNLAQMSGALAIGVCDQLNMLQYSTYSVISPEGCASILWKSADYAADAANAMGITAGRLHDLGLVDHVIKEPLGGAHRDADLIAASIKSTLINQLTELESMDTEALLHRRYKRLMSYGLSS